MRTVSKLLVLGLVGFAISSNANAGDAAVKITRSDTHLDITVDGQPFTTYWFGKREDRVEVRPFFYPVYAPGQVQVTSDQYSLKEKDPKADHPHHQSLWVAHGEVNGVDHWTFGKDGKGTHSARMRHVKFDAVEGDHFVEQLVWEDASQKAMLNEVRTVRFGAFADGSRFVDVTSDLTAAEDVTLGDTKEAGMLAVRVAPQISKAPTITQSTGKGGEGMAGEKETWGKAADWCDESGMIDGKPFGIAIFDAKSNPRHPARWHVRAYGLVASNIFALSEYDKKNPKHSGDMKLEKGKSVKFEHMAVIHAGSAADAKLAEKYARYGAE